MEYAEVLQGIHGRKTFSSTASLERIRRLMERLGNPQNRVRCVHVAGTNGKGSTCALVESALRQAGYRVGLFTSPYLVDFRERIQINREMISKELLTACYQQVMAAEDELEREGVEAVNEFELVTALGFTAFAAAEVDYGVIEVGLGGRCDATNVISAPAVCCITSISLDHTGVLGNTVEEIAREKAGILKPGCPAVMAPQEPGAEEVSRETAKGLGCLLIPAASWSRRDDDCHGQRLTLDGVPVSLPLLGRFQGDNAAAAWSVCRQLGLDAETIRQGFSQVSWPGRLQYVAPGLLIDAGHNPAGIAALCEALDRLFPNRRKIAVMSMMRDKDHQGCVPMVAKRCRLLVATTVSLPRSLPPEELAREAAPYCSTRTAADTEAGIALARELAGPEDLIVVCGSVYGAGAAIGAL